MKALTLHQPWASLVAFGEKKIETRSWPTSYRGRLAIHSAKLFPSYAWDCAQQGAFRSALARHGFTPNELPLGCVLVIVELEQVVMTEYMTGFGDPSKARISEQERAFGNFAPKRYAWVMRVTRKLEEPIRARGYQGLWEFDSRSHGIL